MRCSFITPALAALSSVAVVAVPLKATLASRYASLASVDELSPLSKRGNCAQYPSQIDMGVVREIYKAVHARTHDRKALVITYATCLTESYCNNLNCGDGFSHGAFQQQSDGDRFTWGTVADTMNVTTSTNNFLNVMLKHYHANPNAPANVIAQQTQIASAGDQYVRSLAKANELADQMIKENPGGNGGGDDAPSTPKPTKATPTKQPQATSTKTAGNGGAINVGANPNQTAAPHHQQQQTPHTGDDGSDNGDDDCDDSLPPCDKFYVPVPGDNCYKVADMFNISLDQFYKLNTNLDDHCQNLYAGQKYCVAASDV